MTSTSDTSTPKQPSAAPCGPLTACWRSAYPAGRVDRYPDAVTDTTRRRATRARRIMPQVRAVRRAALAAGGDAALIHFVLDLPGNVYDLDQSAARATVAAVVGDWPTWYTRETAPDTRHHAHGVTTRSAAAALEAAGAYVVDVKPGRPPSAPGERRKRTHLARLVHYLSKPQDARACRLKHQRDPDPAALAAAAEDYLAARYAAHQQGRRLPNRSATLNTPGPATRSPLVSLLACLAAAGHELARCCAERTARRARIAAVMTHRRAARHQHPTRPPVARKMAHGTDQHPAADGNPQTANRQRPPPPRRLRPVDALR